MTGFSHIVAVTQRDKRAAKGFRKEPDTAIADFWPFVKGERTKGPMEFQPSLSAIERLAARIFHNSSRLLVVRMEAGMSTSVYRIRRAEEVFYLRVLPEAGASFAPEALAHRLLREQQARVPEVVYYELYDEALQRSVMVTTEIKGAPLADCAEEQGWRGVLVEAGRDLAIINSLPVQGFGWINRDGDAGTRLAAEHPSSRAFLCEYLERDLTLLENERVLKVSDVEALRRVLGRYDAWLDAAQAWLAHGDFDATHIYQEGGRYTGIIDFGEIRGADAFYDLGHFRMHDGEKLPALLLPWLIEGYRQGIDLPPDYEQRVAFASLLIAVRALARTWGKRPALLPGHYGLRSIRRDLAIF